MKEKLEMLSKNLEHQFNELQEWRASNLSNKTPSLLQSEIDINFDDKT